MSHLRLAIYSLAVSMSYGALAAPPSTTDIELARQLVGTWRGVEVRPNAEVRGTTTLKPNHTFKLEVHVSQLGQAASKVEAEGSWSVEHGFVVQTIATSNNAALAPPGSVTRDRIVALGARALELESENGRRLFRHRE